MTADATARYRTGWPILTGLMALAVLLGGFATWAALTSIAGAVVVSGRIEVEQNRQVVQHPDGGPISDILVAEGMEVAAGQVLIRIDAAALSSELALLEAQLFDVMAQQGRNKAEHDDLAEPVFDPLLLSAAQGDPAIASLLAGQRQWMAARRDARQLQTDQLELRIQQIARQIEGLTAQRQAVEIQKNLIMQELANQKILLDRGLAQAGPVLDLQRELAAITGVVGAVDAQRAEAESRIAQIRLELLQLRDGQREEAITRLRDLQPRELDMREKRRALMERLNRLEVRAPVAGIVHGLQVHSKGAVLRPADPILSIVPQDQPLIVTAQIDPLHVGSVFPGQKVTLRFPSVRNKGIPDLAGRVARISADAFADQASGRFFYRAAIIPDVSVTAGLPDGPHLMPGMPVDVLLRTSDRTVLEYLLKPLADGIELALREE
ncbi:MAG: HlyD family type I secretion periplasmic adaptor subunit [Rhodobacterales bacterium]|nr:HlyD family type I secretion periplasmic adaptor subunit [Rhodobacterales bacterium]MDX5389177.1 HlyD family type I secretion periplasmic adaptor subunit [Rhodobacterales bacterium]MDX5488874.1 HlyD family type I secretion periplasmic adaptor subunit [Rhodobacterales bacterium]